jgi:hypothetical protein
VPTIIDFVERNERRPPSDREERRAARERRQHRGRSGEGGADVPAQDAGARDTAA